MSDIEKVKQFLKDGLTKDYQVNKISWDGADGIEILKHNRVIISFKFNPRKPISAYEADIDLCKCY